MIAWFRRLMGWGEVDALAMVLAEIFSRHIAVGQVKKSAVVEKAFLLVLAQAKGEKRKRGWRGNKAARLANTFGWQLISLGYPKEFSLALAKKLAVHLAQKKQ